MSVPMIASKGFTYAGRRLKAGDPFEARGESDARVLEAIQNARRGTVPPPPLPDPLPIATDGATKRGRGYRKQALEAESLTSATQNPPPSAGDASPSDLGNADKPEPGQLEAAQDAQPADGASAADAPTSTRRHYRRRDLAGAAE